MRKPWVQIAIDALEMDRGKKLAQMAMNAGADWIEVGTPLITYQGIRAINEIAQICVGKIIVADFKAQDGVAKYFREAGRQGAKIATVLGIVSDASIKAAIIGGREVGVKVTADMYSIKKGDLAVRAKELEILGVDYLMLHLGIDEINEVPTKHPLDGLLELLDAVNIPVGVGTFNQEQAVEAIRMGASFVVQGEPILSAENAEKKLSQFISAVKTEVE